MTSRTILRSSILGIFSVAAFQAAGFAQLSKSVGLLKADVTLADGSPARDVPVAIFRGVDRVSTTKSSPDGKITTVLQPNSVYRFVVNSNDYLYHEDTLNIGALKSYTEFPFHIVVSPLVDGATFDLSQPIFAPRSQDILPGSHEELDRAVTELKHNPKLSASITVYPDGMPKNKKDNSQTVLANARMNAMRSYFLGKGIPESRFSVMTNTSSLPPGKFEATNPAFPPQTAVATKSKGKKKKSEPATSGMIPQYVAIVGHVQK